MPHWHSPVDIPLRLITTFIIKSIEKMKSLKILAISSLDDLKSKLLKVVVIVLVVTFFKYALDYEYKNPVDLMLLAGGTVLIAISAYLSHNGA